MDILQQSYQFNLNYEIQPQLSITAKLFSDIPTSVLICVTNIGKVLIYTPRGQIVNKDNNNNAQFLNIPKKISSIASCQFHSAQSQNDKIILASQNTLMIYDVERNLDLFYREIPDGVFSVCYGEMHIASLKQSKPLAFIGSDCQIQGFDQSGEESYWNVTGDQVTAMYYLKQTNQINASVLIVASADSSIRIFQQEEILQEISLSTSANLITGLSYQDGIYFAYALNNGSIGVNKNNTCLWINKSISSKIVSILQVRQENDQQVLVVGRTDGTIDIIKDLTGQLIYRHPSTGQNLSQLLYDDINGSQKKQIIAIYQDGSVKGYTLCSQESISNNIIDSTKFSEVYEKLNERKLELMNKLNVINEASKTVQMQIIPKGTKVIMGFAFSAQTNRCIDLVLQSSEQSTYIKQVILISDTLFLPYNSYVFTPEQSNYMIMIPLNMIRDNRQIEIKARALISSNGSGLQYQVLETRNLLPKFCQFMLINCDNNDNNNNNNNINKTGQLSCIIKERIPRFVKWFDQCFIIDDQVIKQLDGMDNLNLQFQNIQTQETLIFLIKPSIGQFQIQCDSIELAGDLVQDLCNFLNLQDLNTEGIFPIAIRKLQDAIEKVELLKQAKHQLNADVADYVNKIKENVVRAEDARIMNKWSDMRKWYSSIMIENNQLQSELLKKDQNNEVLMDALRQINTMISYGSNIRIGKFKDSITSMCRNAVKSKNLYNLISIIQYGREK